MSLHSRKLLAAACLAALGVPLTLSALAQDPFPPAAPAQNPPVQSPPGAGNANPGQRRGAGGAPVSTNPRDAQPFASGSFDSIKPDLPTLFIAGDSTAATGNARTRGWGAVLNDYFDTSKINIVNYAAGGRSFRTYTTEGRWDAIVEHIKPGDFVVIELGHNDGGGANGRGSIQAVGDETVEVSRPDGTKEVVHTYGWYTRKYVRDTVAKGGIPIVSTVSTRNLWNNDNTKVERGMGRMRDFAEQVATEEKAAFVDHSNLTADHYEKIGREESTKLHSDRTHTTTAGAIVNAETLIAGLRAIPDLKLNTYLNAKGQAIPAVAKQPHWGTYSPGPAP